LIASSSISYLVHVDVVYIRKPNAITHWNVEYW